MQETAIIVTGGPEETKIIEGSKKEIHSILKNLILKKELKTWNDRKIKWMDILNYYHGFRKKLDETILPANDEGALNALRDSIIFTHDSLQELCTLHDIDIKGNTPSLTELITIKDFITVIENDIAHVEKIIKIIDEKIGEYDKIK